MSKSNFANIIFLSVLSVTLFLVSCSTEEDEKLPPMSSSSGASCSTSTTTCGGTDI